MRISFTSRAVSIIEQVELVSWDQRRKLSWTRLEVLEASKLSRSYLICLLGILFQEQDLALLIVVQRTILSKT